jgi:hypothetical protein
MTKANGEIGVLTKGHGAMSPRLSLFSGLILGLMFFAVGCSSTMPQNKNLRLIRAAEKGQTREIVVLLRDGADINAMDEQGWTPYLAASTNGHLDAMKLLRAFGARTEAPEKETLARFNMVR